MEIVIKEATTRVRVIKIGDENQYNKRNNDDKLNFETLMLTGDENIVDVVFEVHWKIIDLKKFIFSVKDKNDTIAYTASSVVREVISKEKLSAILTNRRSSIEEESKKILQSILNEYNMGVEIVRLQMLKVDPPVQVIDAFRDVQTARVDRESEINKALLYENKVLPSARGQAGKIMQDAEAYGIKVVNDAKANTERFNKVYEQYKTQPYATRKRMYLDTMEKIFKDNKFIILDNSLKNIILNTNFNDESKSNNDNIINNNKNDNQDINQNIVNKIND